jgi:hypothetical protein
VTQNRVLHSLQRRRRESVMVFTVSLIRVSNLYPSRRQGSAIENLFSSERHTSTCGSNTTRNLSETGHTSHAFHGLIVLRASSWVKNAHCLKKQTRASIEHVTKPALTRLKTAQYFALAFVVPGLDHRRGSSNEKRTFEKADSNLP